MKIVQPPLDPSEITAPPTAPNRTWVWVLLFVLLALLIFNGLSSSAIDANEKVTLNDLTSQFQGAVTQTPPFLTNSALSGVLDQASQSSVKGSAFLRVTMRVALATPNPHLKTENAVLSGFSAQGQLKPEDALQKSNKDFADLLRGQGNERILAEGLQATLNQLKLNEKADQPATGSPAHPATKKGPELKPPITGAPPPIHHPSGGVVTGPPLTGAHPPQAGVPAFPAPLQPALDLQLSQIHPVGFTQTYALALIKQSLLHQKGAIEAVTGNPPPVTGLVVALGLYATVFCCGLALFTVYFYLRAHNALPDFIHPAEAQTPEEGNRLALQAAALLAIFIMAMVGAALITGFTTKSGGTKSATSQLWLMAGLELAMVAATVALTWWKPWGIRLSLGKMGLTWPKLKQTVLWGLAGFCVVNFSQITLSVLLAPLIHSGGSAHPLTRDLGTMSHNEMAIIATFISACIGAPFFEEFVFRGVLTPAFRKVFGPGPNSLFWAIILTSMIFGMSHPTGPPSWIPLASVGAVNCLLCYQTRSLWPAIISHACFNGAQLLLVLSLAHHGLLTAWL